LTEYGEIINIKGAIMSKIKNGDTVKIEYKAFTKEELLFDSSRQLTPLQITVGKEQIIPAFEQALIGMGPGDEKEFHLSAESAFGPYHDELVTTISKGQLPEDLSFDVGKMLEVIQPDGSTLMVKVIANTQESVTFDANHPLAGKELTFFIKVLEII
jgi:peptidylprolyl isomerase